ncbi:hypothetical protein ABZY06_26620 [Streptomyces sp. NPDC006540]|uniref:hypothetical protein n=1 Tax=Streptomyces sp. NPDC006540 TaxID=3155353 RepID=UPI0033BF065E
MPARAHADTTPAAHSAGATVARTPRDARAFATADPCAYALAAPVARAFATADPCAYALAAPVARAAAVAVHRTSGPARGEDRGTPGPGAA